LGGNQVKVGVHPDDVMRVSRKAKLPMLFVCLGWSWAPNNLFPEVVCGGTGRLHSEHCSQEDQERKEQKAKPLFCILGGM